MVKPPRAAGEPAQKLPATLGDVLYAKAKPPVAEREWAALVAAIAAGDQAALHALYERSHRPVFTLALRLELHLLAGELWIDARKLYPGDYNYGAPGAGDERVWSETGCTCVLVTSTKDVLR